MVGHPRVFGVKVTFYAVICPVGQFLFDGGFDGLGLQTEGVAAEVDVGCAVGAQGVVKAVAVGAEWVVFIGAAGEGEGGLVVHFCFSFTLILFKFFYAD